MYPILRSGHNGNDNTVNLGIDVWIPNFDYSANIILHETGYLDDFMHGFRISNLGRIHIGHHLEILPPTSAFGLFS